MQAEELWNHFIEEYPRYKHHTYEAWQYVLKILPLED